ncbi:MAG: GTPase Era [Alphaproteobacteria bacterium]|jgi:GTP-binding protein Era|nr:GTPase Era [Alphaproteobacteria bacterium]MCV6599308.1 GTPase Era [Alphaproteobacteria bacterium]
MPKRCGFVALIGSPNAGKSTLLNRYVGSKISIVSQKVQTTRSKITGITIHNKTQLIFIDTPGIFAPKKRLDKAMVSAAWQGADNADCILFLVDASSGINDDVIAIVENLKKCDKQAILVLNKVDKIDPKILLGLAQNLSAYGVFSDVFMISAKTGSGTDDLLNLLAEKMPKGTWLYPDDHLSDMPLRFLTSEITREKILESVHDEIPYKLTVETEKWEEMKNGSVKIHQIIFVQTNSHKAILLGEGGKKIKHIGIKSRQDISNLISKDVHLKLFVKVRKKWQDNPERYRNLGLEFHS